MCEGIFWLVYVTIAAMIEIYHINIDSCLQSLDQLLQQLTVSEQQSAGRLVSQPARQSYIVSHYALRVLLARALGCALSDVEYQATAQGKPELVSGGVQFNLSHSGDRALVAISRAGAVGVDVEHCRSRARLLQLAGRFFAADEVTYVQSARDSTHAFYQIWTAKEAYLKALGVGLAGGLDRFSVVDDAGGFKSQLGPWHLKAVSLSGLYQGYLVAEEIDQVRVQSMVW